jgi:hypothetical protein
MDAAWPKDSRPYQARNTGIKTRAGVSFTRRLWETEGDIVWLVDDAMSEDFVVTLSGYRY